VSTQLVEDLAELERLLARPYGWCKSTWYRPEPRCDDGLAYCLDGAMAEATCSDTSWGDRYATLRDAVLAELPEPFMVTPSFNDAPKTRKRDVLALVRRARQKTEGS
jgi:hypothetical protein